MSGRYEVDPEPLGEGGMAVVHRAEVTSGEGFRRPVAIKYIHEALSDQPHFEVQFRGEAQLIALLRHPNIVQVLDFDRDARGRLFLAMELVEGTDLRRVRDHGPLPIGLAVHVVAEVLKGLVYAHAAKDEQGRAIGLVHRDLSPQNVLVSWDGAVKISDFGIAQGIADSNTKTGVVKGNAGYMSPEQIEGDALDARSDVYAVGVLLHELLIGAPLYARPGMPTRSILAQILLGRAQPPSQLRADVPSALSDFVVGLLSHDRQDRPPSAKAALRGLLALDMLPPTAGLDLAHYLESVRRTTERPTVLDEEPPRDVALATAPMPYLDTVALKTQPQITPIEGIRSSVRSQGWLPWFTIALGVTAVGLGVALFQPAVHEPGVRGSLNDSPAQSGAVSAWDSGVSETEPSREVSAENGQRDRIEDASKPPLREARPTRIRSAKAQNQQPGNVRRGTVPTSGEFESRRSASRLPATSDEAVRHDAELVEAPAPPDAGATLELLPYEPGDGLLPYGSRE